MYKFIISICLVLATSFLAATAEVEKVVILGKGPAGLSAAIFSGQANLRPLVLTGPECTTQLGIIHSIDNYPGFPEPIPGKELLDRLQEQAVKFGTRIDDESVVIEVDLENRPFRLLLENGDTIFTESLIIAQGVNRNWLGLEAEEMLKGKGVMGTSICHKEECEGKIVAVVGGGHAALQEAIMISEYASSVILINRGNKFNASMYHQELAFANDKIRILFDTEVTEILDSAQEKVTGIELSNKVTKEKTKISVDGIVIAIGSTPNSNIFDGKLELTKSGHIALPGKTTQSSVPGVFAAGDVSELTYGRVAVSSGTGAMAALDAIKYLATQKQ